MSEQPAEGVQPPPPPPPPPSQPPCPDPGPPYIDYTVDGAGAAKQSELYTADAALVDPRYDKLDGAQSAYEKTKVEQQAAYQELTDTMTAITSTFECHPDKEVRDQLTKCWEDLLKETTEATAPPSCTDVDSFDCSKAGTKTIAELTALASEAANCVAQADAVFDRLADLPTKLEATIADLDKQAKDLKQVICDTPLDLKRTFVVYLKLKDDVAKLETDWIEAAKYTCALKAAFVTLVKRHFVVICIAVAITRWQKRKELEDKAKHDRASHLIDLVLECATPKPVPTTSTEPPPAQTGC